MRNSQFRYSSTSCTRQRRHDLDKRQSPDDSAKRRSGLPNSHSIHILVHVKQYSAFPHRRDSRKTEICFSIQCKFQRPWENGQRPTAYKPSFQRASASRPFWLIESPLFPSRTSASAITGATFWVNSFSSSDAISACISAFFFSRYLVSSSRMKRSSSTFS